MPRQTSTDKSGVKNLKKISTNMNTEKVVED